MSTHNVERKKESFSQRQSGTTLLLRNLLLEPDATTGRSTSAHFWLILTRQKEEARGDDIKRVGVRLSSVCNCPLLEFNCMNARRYGIRR